jgi:eukaryotic-like serine/threonine-protein kinase
MTANAIIEKLNKLIVKIGKEKLIRIGIAAGTFIAGFLILLLIADIFVMPAWTRKGSETEVPNVIDLSLQAAETRLKEADLSVVNGGEEYDPQRPKGTVIIQVPEGGAMVKSGRRVVLTLSKGSASATVPGLEGFTLREAGLLLEKEGLRQGIITWYTDESRPDGVIIGSIPPAGTVMKLNADVQLIVNRIESEMMVKVPDFNGLDLDKAKSLAEENYLLIGDLSYTTDESLLPETVVGQSVPAGLEVKKWTAINLTVTLTE